MARRRRTSSQCSRPSRGTGGTSTCLELRYQPPPSRLASSHGTGRFSSQRRRANLKTKYLHTRGFLPNHELLASWCSSSCGTVNPSPWRRSGGYQMPAPLADLKKALTLAHLQCPAIEASTMPPTNPRVRKAMHAIKAAHKICNAPPGKLCRAEDEAYVSLQGGPVREARGQPHRIFGPLLRLEGQVGHYASGCWAHV
jgi:hypothetical protein